MIHMKRCAWTLGLVSWLAPAVPGAVSAEIVGAPCVPGSGPAATLLFPYFEVDVDDPAGRTTLLSISNTVEDPAIAQIVVWTNSGEPALDFTVHLPGFGVRSLDMANVIVQGELPSTWPGSVEAFPGCSEELLNPTLSDEELTQFRQRLEGQIKPGGSACTAFPPRGSLLTGYLTADVLNDCSSEIRTPFEPGYFEPGGSGLASSANVLSGDFFLLDGRNDSAQGFEAVAIVADAARADSFPASTFYARGDDRLPLGSRYRTRILQGGGFSAGTELVVWVHDVGQEVECETFPGEPCADGCLAGFDAGMDVVLRDEQGNVRDQLVGRNLRGVVERLKVGDDVLFESPFGSAELSFVTYSSFIDPPRRPSQAWVLPIYRGAGRFSAGVTAVALDAFCE